MLIGNYTVRNKTPGRWLAGGSTAGTNQGQARSNFGCTGPARGVHYGDGETAAKKTWGCFQGMYGDSAWLMPYTPQEMVSQYEGDFALAATAQGVLGMPGEGSASIAITVADVAGEMIVSGQGEASFAITANTPLLTASINGAGTASMSAVLADAILGAEASLGGEASFAVTVAPANRYPTNDASPLREASASFAVTGSLTPYAIGIMEGSTVDATGMTPTTVARAVWDAALAEFQASGTTGEALAGAGAAGNPWLAPLDAYTQEQAGGIIKIIQRILQNKQITDPETGTMTVYDDDGVTPLLQANLYEDAAGTKPYEGKGAERRDAFA